MLRFESRHGPRKSVTQSLDHLEQREIDVGSFLAENEVAAFAVAFENSFKVAEKLGHSVRGEMRGAFFGLRGLFLIIQDVRDRMVRLARFIQPIGDRQLQLMRSEPARFAFRYETQPGRKKLENVGGLGNQELAGFQKRRGKRRTF